MLFSDFSIPSAAHCIVDLASGRPSQSVTTGYNYRNGLDNVFLLPVTTEMKGGLAGEQ